MLLLLLTALSCFAKDGGHPKSTTIAQDSLTQLASRLYNEGNYKTTLELRDPTDSLAASPKLLFYQGMSYAALYDYPRALDAFQMAIRGDSTNVNYRFQYGRLLIQAGFTEDAAIELSQCIALDTTYLPASFQLGLLYNAQKNNPAKEEAIFSFLIRQNPNDFVSLYYKGDVLRRLNLADSGITFIQRSIAVNPRYFPSLIACAHYQDANKLYGPALKCYRQAEEIRPHDKDLLFQIGECSRKLGELKTAVIYFKKSLAIDSSNAPVLAQLGYAYYSLGRFDSSIQSYNAAIAIDGDNILYYQNLALAYQKIDSVQGAIRAYQKAIEVLHPENIMFANRNLASFYYSNGMKQEAIKSLQQNISYDYNSLAGFYFSKNMSRDAATAYQHVVELDSTNFGAIWWLGTSLEELHDYKAAIRVFEKGMRLIEGDTTKTMEMRGLKATLEFCKKKML
jgi:tetratricopeptide (TPR) repeat protein